MFKLALLDLLGHETLTAKRSESVVEIVPLPEEERGKRLRGRDFPANGMTMVGKARLDNVQQCVESVIADGIPGDLIEAGVWRGGVPILMRAILRAHGADDRAVWLADSFEGLPPPSPEQYPADAASKAHLFGFLAVSLEEVRRNFERYGMLDEQVRFVKGWFRDTLPGLRGHRWSVVRLDGDLYESTMVALESLYPSLSVGGYVIVDDYCLLTCKHAVHEYRDRHGIREEIVPIDWTGVYWRKQADAGS